LTHPDKGGDHDLFLWATGVYEYVSSDAIPEPPPRVRREPPRHTTTGDRIPFDTAYERFDSHEDLVAFALLESERMGGVFGRLLGMLHDCYPSVPGDHVLERQERIGPTYRQLAYAGRLAGMDARRRAQWYEVARYIPLSQRCVGHIISRLHGEAA
jgi:hypothetical protein